MVYINLKHWEYFVRFFRFIPRDLKQQTLLFAAIQETLGVLRILLFFANFCSLAIKSEY